MVPAMLRDMATALPKELDRMNMGRKPAPVRFGILGLFLDHFGSPVQRASLSPVPADVPEAIAQRITYSTSKGAQGNLLPAPEGDLVPLELVWFNATLPEVARDPQLTAMANAIAATQYPEEDPRFVDLDTRLIIEGY
ncbi:hypothetical protein [Sagittula sp. S175]|uniref:hypothetical protein n=1 Tax=Sagittula sp. S175 TaxID=3415129 RepID=UPI003C7DDAC1